MLKLISLLSLVTLLGGARLATAQERETVTVQIEFTAEQETHGETEVIAGLALEFIGFGRANAKPTRLESPIHFFTDEHGTGNIKLQLPEALPKELFNRRRQVILRVNDPRFTYQELNVRVREHGENPYAGKINPVRGGTVRGRIVDAAGLPNRTTVRLNSVGSDIQLRTQARNGEFEIHYSEPGEYELSGYYKRPLALCNFEMDGFVVPKSAPQESGACEPTRLTLSGGLHEANITLKLPREAELAGRLLQADGQPIPGVLLRADWFAELDGAAERNAWPEPLASKVRTNAEGAFEFAGLRPGKYLISYRVGCDRNNEPHILASTDEEDIVLRCDVQRIVLAVLDADGNQLRLNDGSMRNLPYFHGEYTITDLDTPSSQRPTYQQFERCIRFVRGEFEHSFIAVPGHRYQFHLLPHDGPPMMQTIQCPESEQLSRVQFRFPKPETLGTLRVTLSEQVPLAHNREYAFALTPLGSDTRLFATGFNERGYKIKLQPGEYKFLAGNRSLIFPVENSPSKRGPNATPLFTFESTIRITAGQEVTLPIAPEPGGRLDLRLAPEQPREGDSVPMIQLREHATSADVPIRWLALPAEENPAAFELGERRSTFETLAAGRYEVIVTCGGYQTAQREFEIEDNEFTFIHLELER